RKMGIGYEQLEIQKRIVPEDKDDDQFIKLLHGPAATSGIDIRRYTAMPVNNREFYSEVPFAIDIDGPYYSVLNFFQRVAELERIVNISNMQMTNMKNGSAAKVKGSGYNWGPHETVLASCTATTFFSHEPEEVPPPAGKPGQPGQPGQSAQPAAAQPGKGEDEGRPKREIEMKLIQILALATAMATMATAQNSSATGQNGGTAKPAPTATPAAAKKGGASAKPTVKAASAAPAGKNAGSTAKPSNGQAASAKPAVTSGAAPAPAAKPVVKTGTVAAKKGSAAQVQSNGPAAKGKSAPTAPTPANSGPAAKAGSQPPAVIAVKPPQGPATKKAGATPAKTPGAAQAKKAPAAAAPAPKVTQVAPPAEAKPAEKPK